jgi:uncharacterized protein YerC
MVEKIKKMLIKGVKQKEIQEATGVNLTTIVRIARTVPPRKAGKANNIPQSMLDEWDTVTSKLRKGKRND